MQKKRSFLLFIIYILTRSNIKKEMDTFLFTGLQENVLISYRFCSASLRRVLSTRIRVTNTPLDLAMRFNRSEVYAMIEKCLNSMILKDNTLALIAAKKKRNLIKY